MATQVRLNAFDTNCIGHIQHGMWTHPRDRSTSHDINPPIGSAEEVVDEPIAWVEETGMDGFNRSRGVTPETLEEFIDLVMPVLRHHGVYKHQYAVIRSTRNYSDVFGGWTVIPRRRTGAPPLRPSGRYRSRHQ
jgi:hypothetical protein